MRRRLTLILGVVWLALCGLSLIGVANSTEQDRKETSHPKQDAPKACELTDEDYSVFTSVLQNLGKPEDPEEEWKDKEIMVLNVTSSGKVEAGQWNGWGFRSNSNAAPSPETRADFEARNQSRCPLKQQWGDTSLYKPLANKEEQEFFNRKHDGWKEFYKKYPKAAGIWSFSQPGYNRAKDEAVLYVTHICGWLCGTGHLVFLTKADGRWKVKNRLFLWIS